MFGHSIAQKFDIVIVKGRFPQSGGNGLFNLSERSILRRKIFLKKFGIWDGFFVVVLEKKERKTKQKEASL